MFGLITLFALIVLVVHLSGTLLSKAFRSYSPSQLEEICEAAGRPERAAQVMDDEEESLRAADVLAVGSGLLLAALLALAAHGLDRTRLVLLLAVALLGAAIGRATVDLLAHVHAEAILDRSWTVASWVRALLGPLVRLVEWLERRAYRDSSRGLKRPRPRSVELELTGTGGEPVHDESPLELSDRTQSQLERAVLLANRSVDEVMIPRSAVRSLPVTATAAEAARAFVDTGFSRIPLYGEHRDDIIGILYMKDLFARLVDDSDSASIDLRKLARAPLYVPETKNAPELIDELRERKIQMAVVLDEYGAVTGLVTLEDLIEELVGEINDEYDVPDHSEQIVALGDGRFEIDAGVPIEEVNSRLGLQFATDEEYSTLGGLAFSTLGHLPDPGTEFLRGGVKFTVLSVEGHSIRRLQLTLPEVQAASESA